LNNCTKTKSNKVGVILFTKKLIQKKIVQDLPAAINIEQVNDYQFKNINQ